MKPDLLTEKPCRMYQCLSCNLVNFGLVVPNGDMSPQSGIECRSAKSQSHFNPTDPLPLPRSKDRIEKYTLDSYCLRTNAAFIPRTNSCELNGFTYVCAIKSAINLLKDISILFCDDLAQELSGGIKCQGDGSGCQGSGKEGGFCLIGCRYDPEAEGMFQVRELVHKSPVTIWKRQIQRAAMTTAKENPMAKTKKREGVSIVGISC